MIFFYAFYINNRLPKHTMETVKFPSLKILILTLKKRAAPSNRAAHFVSDNFCFLFPQP